MSIDGNGSLVVADRPQRESPDLRAASRKVLIRRCLTPRSRAYHRPRCGANASFPAPSRPRHTGRDASRGGVIARVSPSRCRAGGSWRARPAGSVGASSSAVARPFGSKLSCRRMAGGPGPERQGSCRHQPQAPARPSSLDLRSRHHARSGADRCQPPPEDDATASWRYRAARSFSLGKRAL